MKLDPALFQHIVDHADKVSASMRQALAHASFFTAISISFLAGLVFNFNPVSLAVLPTSLVYVTKARKGRQMMVLGGTLIAGFMLSHALMGLVAGFGGLEVKRLVGRFWGIILGPPLILLGLVWQGWVRIPFLSSAFCRRETETRLTPSTLWGHSGWG